MLGTGKRSRRSAASPNAGLSPNSALADLRAIALKRAFRELVGLVGGLAAAAACSRGAGPTLARYYDTALDSTFPPADVVAALEAVAGAAPVTAEIARLSGHRLVPLSAGDGRRLVASVTAFARDAGAVPAALCDGLADGVLTPAEAAAIGHSAARQCAGQRAASAAARKPPGPHLMPEPSIPAPPAAPAVEGEGVPVRRHRPGRGDGGRQSRNHAMTTTVGASVR